MQKLKLILVISAVAAISCNTTASAQKQLQASGKYAILDDLDKRVKFEKIPAMNIVSLQLSGNYQRHPEAYAQLSGYVYKNYATAGGIIGIYPKDPDLFDEPQLTWEIGLRVLPGKPGAVNFPTEEPNDPFTIKIPEGQLQESLSTFKKPAKPYVIKTLEATEAVTLTSDVGHISADGLAINAWISLNNYVQTGTTRTEFGGVKEDPKQIPVKIIVPVKKRIKQTR